MTQEPKENPSAFLERLRECLCILTNIHPKSIEGNAVIQSHFIPPAAPDSRQKLQKLEIEPVTQPLIGGIGLLSAQQQRSQGRNQEMPKE